MIILICYRGLNRDYYGLPSQAKARLLGLPQWAEAWFMICQLQIEA